MERFSHYETTAKTQAKIYDFALKLKLDNIWLRVIYIPNSCQSTQLNVHVQKKSADIIQHKVYLGMWFTFENAI